MLSRLSLNTQTTKRYFSFTGHLKLKLCQQKNTLTLSTTKKTTAALLLFIAGQIAKTLSLTMTFSDKRGLADRIKNAVLKTDKSVFLKKKKSLQLCHSYRGKLWKHALGEFSVPSSPLGYRWVLSTFIHALTHCYENKTISQFRALGYRPLFFL